MHKIIDSIHHPFAPFVLFVLELIANTILRKSGTMALCAAVDIVLTVIMVISALDNLVIYGKKAKTIVIVLCVFMALNSINDLIQSRSDKPRASTTSASSGYSSGSTGSYGGYTSGNTISYGGYSSGKNNSSRGSSSSTAKVCYSCNGSKKCHVCSGKGSFACSGTSCLRGRCTACKGSGLYDHGSYLSRCLVCSGDGICNICNGTSRRDCSICHGSGKCTNCR